MSIGLKQKKIYLDREHCFRTWLNCGSLGKTAKILYSEGMVNPKSGKAPTPPGIENAAHLWMLDNVAEAKRLIAESWLANGELLSDEKWGRLILGYARSSLSNKKYTEFIERHSYLKPYLNG